jgi:hypothetical protein
MVPEEVRATETLLLPQFFVFLPHYTWNFHAVVRQLRGRQIRPQSNVELVQLAERREITRVGSYASVPPSIEAVLRKCNENSLAH